MSRQSIINTTFSPFSSIEAAFRLTVKTLSAPATFARELEMLETEQNRIRATGRHWLLG